ncbi:MAG: ACT domain-containing protein [Pseudomonadota bacterium]
MKQPIVLTVIADDKPGIVQRLSGVVHDYGGTWNQSSMTHLAGRFAGMLLGVVPTDQAEACVDALEALDAEGLSVVVRLGDKTAAPETGPEYHLELVGNDRPGIMADITAVLSEHHVNVHGLETLVEGASMAGGNVFRAYASLRLPEGADATGIEEALEAIADDLMVDVTFER